MFGRHFGALAAAGLAAAIVVLMTGGVASASSRPRSHHPPIVRPRFGFVGNAVGIWAGAQYALTESAGFPYGPGPVPYTPATLIDDQNGQVTTAGQAGCYPVQPSALEPLDLPWVPFNCAPIGDVMPELYSPVTGQWLAVSPSPGLWSRCGPTGCTDIPYLMAAGRYWLGYAEATCDSGGQHCAYANVFQNIQTGELRPDPSAGRTEVDLNAPNLTVRVCRPLTVPTSSSDPYAPGPMPGSLTFYGSFALAIGGDSGTEVSLERCGTHLNRLLTDGRQFVAANADEVVWMASEGPVLNALTLPRLRPFMIRLPSRVLTSNCPDAPNGCVVQAALTDDRLYVLTTDGQVWAAPAPLPPRRRHK